LIDAARYLEGQRRDYGRQFLDEAEAAIELIMQNPGTWRPMFRDVRRYVLPRFRYTIRYRIRTDEDLVEFLSIVHTSRHPSTGLER
jgi:plasmid stabilization system protein ParE